VLKETYSLNYQFEENYWWYVVRRNLIIDWVKNHINLKEDDCILDYGCGTGKLVEVLREAGFKVEGADYSDEAIAFCKKRSIPDIIDLKKQPLEKHSYKIIILADVLEHAEDDTAMLKEVAQSLCENGKLIITVPAYNWLWSGEDFVSQHIRRYSASSLKQVFKQAGIKVSYCTYFNTFLFPLIVATLLYRRLFHPKMMYESDIEVLPKWKNTLLTRVFNFERMFFPAFKFPFGASIGLVCEKTSSSEN